MKPLLLQRDYTGDVVRHTHRSVQKQKTVQQRLQKLRHKMTNLAQDRHKLESYLPYQRYGTLLVAQRVPRGATSATVVDYYSPEQTLVTIPLDPRLSLHDNAQVYFKKSRKAQHGLVKVQELLTQCAAEERYLEGVVQQIEQAEDWETLEAVALELGTSPSQPGTLCRVAVPTPAAGCRSQFCKVKPTRCATNRIVAPARREHLVRQIDWAR